MTFKFDTVFAKLAGVKCAMLDLETFYTKPSAAFYAVGGRIFEPGVPFDIQTSIDPDAPQFELTNRDYLQYVDPSAMLHDPRFTVGQDTLDWTMRNNEVELNRGHAHGLDVYHVLTTLMEWMKFHDVKYVFSNSPRFDASILEHAYDVCDLSNPYLSFRNDMDVRTIRTLLDWAGHPKYTKLEGNRVHSPLDDCTQQILDVNRFLDVMLGIRAQEATNMVAHIMEDTVPTPQ